MITGYSQQTNKHFVLKLISFNGAQLKIRDGQLQNSRQLQNKTVNGAMSITINCMIIDTNSTLWYMVS